MRLLLLEDDRRTSDYVVHGFAGAGHACDAFADGALALVRASHEPYDVLILDRMVPGIDGLTLIRTLRSAKVRTPALLPTALGDVDDRVAGLEAESVLCVHDLGMDLLARRVTRAGRELALNGKEFRLLEVLLRNAGRVVTRTMLLERVWDLHFDPRTSVVETHVSRLRAKVDKPFDRPLVHTVRGVGYSVHVP